MNQFLLNLLYDFYGYNQKIFISLNHFTNNYLLQNFAYILDKALFIGNFALAYLALIIFYYWQFRLLTSQRHSYFMDKYYQLVSIGITYTIFGLVFAWLKFTLNLPRPFCSIDATYYTIINTANERCLSSFPSAHTGLSTLIVYFSWKFFNKWQKIVALLFIVVTGVSRLTLAMHYPADILYSLIITIVIIVASKIIYHQTKYPIFEPVALKLFKMFDRR